MWERERRNGLGGWVRLGGFVLGALAAVVLAGRAQAETSLRLENVQAVLERVRGEHGAACEASVRPVAVADRYALVVASVLCAGEDEQGRNLVRPQRASWAVVDWKEMRLVGGEREAPRGGQVLDLAVIEGNPAVLAVEGDELVLYLLGSEAGEEYRWKCGPSACPFLALQAELLGNPRFPWEPARVLLVAGEGEFLLQVYDLYPPEEGTSLGRMHKVDEFVPAAAWKQELGRTTRLEEEVKAWFLDENVLLKYASMLPLLDREVGEMVLEAADRYLDQAWRGISLHAAGEETVFFATQQPFSLTRVNPKTRKFQLYAMGEFGEHVRPLSLASGLSLLGAFPITKSILGLAVQGPVCESMEQYSRNHVGGSCKGELVERDSGGQACCYELTALVRYNLETDHAEWEIWEDYAKNGEALARLVVQVSRAGATCLVATPEGTIRRTSCARP